MVQVIAAPLATALGGGIIATGVAQVAVGLAVSAIANSFANSNRPPTPGLKTQTTTAGESTGQTFMLGSYATAGNFVCPRLAHQGNSNTPNAYRTLVIDLSDVAGADWNGTLYVNDERVSFNGATHPDYGETPLASKYNDKIWCKFYDGTQVAADPHLLATYGAHPERPWSAAMIGAGIAYAIVTIKFDRELWGGREPSIKFEMRGIPLYDISQDDTAGGTGAHRWNDPSTWTSGNTNPVVMIYNILRGISVKNGKIYGGRAEAEDLPAAEWIAAIDACNILQDTTNMVSTPETVWADMLAAVSHLISEATAIANGQITTYPAGFEVRLGSNQYGGDEPADVIEELLRACGGQIADIGGTISIRVGDPPIASEFITDGDIYVTKSQSLQPFTELEESYNAVTCTYPSRADAYQSKEAVPYRDAAAEAEDGVYLPASIQLSAVTNERQVQHLMRQWGLNARRMVRHTFTMPPRGLLLNPLDVFDWTSDDYGYTGKDFEVQSIGIDPSSLSATIACREIDPTDTAWVPAYEATTFAPSTVPTVIATQIVPGWLVAGVAVEDETGTTRRPGILVTWSVDLPDVTGIEIEVRTATTNADVWQGVTTDVESGRFVISGGIVANAQYEVRGRLVTGRAVNWTAWSAVTTPDVRLSLADLDDAAALAIAQASQVPSVASLPADNSVTGDVVFLTTDERLYKWDGAAWVTVVNTTDLEGTIAEVQIATGAITATKIADDAITTPKLAAGAVTASEIAANAVTAGKILAGAVNTSELAADAVTAGKVAAGAIGATAISANAITAGKIAANAITTTNIVTANITTDLINGNAVSNSGYAIGANANYAGESWQDIISFSVARDAGFDTIFNVSFVYQIPNSDGAATYRLRMRRDGSTFQTINTIDCPPANNSDFYSGIFTDPNGGSGTTTYAVQIDLSTTALSNLDITDFTVTYDQRKR